MELRLHGRGGQGGVTCAKLLAAAFARMGQHVQTFGDYAGERSGAPVRAYTRTSPTRIENRNKVYTPDHVIVLDYGEKISDGTCDQVKNDPNVIAAYLGVEQEEVDAVATEVGL